MGGNASVFHVFLTSSGNLVYILLGEGTVSQVFCVHKLMLCSLLHRYIKSYLSDPTLDIDAVPLPQNNSPTKLPYSKYMNLFNIFKL